MTFLCLGYRDELRWAALPESERLALVEDGRAYDAELRRGGYVVAAGAFRGDAVTLRHRAGHVAVTDGPFAGSAEGLAGLLILEARDLNHAIQLLSRHPGVRGGAFEIHAAAAPAQS
jgi:hypothetical protein